MINSEKIEKLLKEHPEEYRPLIEKQIYKMLKLIDNNMDNYRNTPGFREAMDIVLIYVLNGDFAYEEE